MCVSTVCRATATLYVMYVWIDMSACMYRLFVFLCICVYMHACMYACRPEQLQRGRAWQAALICMPMCL